MLESPQLNNKFKMAEGPIGPNLLPLTMKRLSKNIENKSAL